MQDGRGLLDITEVSAATGLRPSALRYYEQEGLVASAGRRGNRRQYAPDVLDRVALIALAQRCGFSLHEVRGVLAGGLAERERWRRAVEEKVAELDRRIAETQAVRDRLAHALSCPAGDLSTCPHLQKSLRESLPAR